MAIVKFQFEESSDFTAFLPCWRVCKLNLREACGNLNTNFLKSALVQNVELIQVMWTQIRKVGPK